ncbi:glycogen synthase kinase mutation revertant [Diplodia corticola]|uniref:Glycogen synthase kinase mutation revertant n=1 Tax=Diplodia corticola TaxID=236234 RepID=A0A1J9RL86_9PEZI|nr:glycogen synthase kinase mutation revertant [Diplodia corticola]OJD28684.1 glycogen synthase kinase mutation revertant [Diplodia corticola]
MASPQSNDNPQPIDQIPPANLIGYVKAAHGFQVLYVEPDSETATFRASPAESLPSGLGDRYLIQPPKDVHVHVVVSVLSGSCLAESFYQKSLKPLLDAIGLQQSVDYTVHRTVSATTVLELTRDVFLPQANKGAQQRIILLSGDGGVVDVVNGLLSGPRSTSFVAPSVALIPMGTGNALAHSSGITADNTMGLATVARGSPVKLPLLKVHFSPGARLLVEEGSKKEELPQSTSEDPRPVMYGAVVCSWAMHAGLVADSDTAEYRKYGVERFKMAAKEALYPAGGSEPHRYRAKLSRLRNKDGQASWEAVDREEHAYVLATLVSNLEKTFNISPHTRPLDGRLALIHLGPMPSDEVMRVMGLAYQEGKHVDQAEVHYEDIEGVRIDFLEDEDRWRRVCVDGKIVLVEKGGWVEARRVQSEQEQVVELACLR